MLFLEEITANPLSPMGGLFISSTFEEGLNRESGVYLRGGAYLIYQNGVPYYFFKQLEDGINSS